jgi:hypothetical protein
MSSPTRKIKNTELLGQYFHSLENNAIKWQGLVIGKLNDEYYLVQLCEWLMGEPSVQRIVSIYDMRDWFFYDSSESMIHSYEYGTARHYRAELKKEKS